MINSTKAFTGQPVSLGIRLTPHSTLALTSPPWIKSVVNRIDYLLLLPHGWDGEDGCALQFEIAMSAIEFLLSKAFHDTPAPQITPTSEGGVQLEWHTGGCDLEITFAPGHAPTFFYAGANGERDGDALTQETALSEIMRQLSAGDKVHTL